MPCDFTVKILHKHLKEQSNAKKIKYLRHLGDGAWIWLRRPLARVLQRPGLPTLFPWPGFSAGQPIPQN